MQQIGVDINKKIFNAFSFTFISNAAIPKVNSIKIDGD